MEATLAALETMNFNRRGISPTVHALGTMIPFRTRRSRGWTCCTAQRAARCRSTSAWKDPAQVHHARCDDRRGDAFYASMMGDDDDYKERVGRRALHNWFIPFQRRQGEGADPVRAGLPVQVRSRRRCTTWRRATTMRATCWIRSCRWG